MIQNLKPYPAYRDSGVEWLGEVPTDWEIHRLDRLFSLRKESPVLGDPRVTGYLNGRVTLRSNVPGQKIKGVIKDAGWQRIYPGDFAISGMNAHMGGMGVSDALGQCSPIYLVLIAHLGIDPQFVSHAVREQAFSGALRALVNTIRFNSADFKREDIKKVWIALPPPFEQSAIVRFLDHADRRLRRAVRAKRQMIALLNEQKQAIIHRAVTRGLDPNVPVKPSGVEWLGEVPAHWEIKALKRVLRQLIDCEHKTAPKVDSSEYRVIRTTAVRHGHLNLQGTYCTSAEGFDEWTCRGCPEPGDVVFTREAPAGEACVIPPGYKFCLGQRTVLMKVRKDHYDSQYLVHIIDVGPPRHFIKLASQGSTVSHFNIEDIAILPVLVPPFEEQIAIVNHLEKVVRSMDNEMQNTQREIDLLLEFRTRLIADVVTGKLDVREAAAGLPDEAEEPALFDEVEVLDENEDSDMEEEADE